MNVIKKALVVMLAPILLLVSTSISGNPTKHLHLFLNDKLYHIVFICSEIEIQKLPSVYKSWETDKDVWIIYLINCSPV